VIADPVGESRWAEVVATQCDRAQQRSVQPFPQSRIDRNRQIRDRQPGVVGQRH
jgi:hypothetical protein